MARSKKCSRGKKAVRSHKRSSGKNVKSYCRKTSSKVSRKVSRKASRKASRKVSRKASRKVSRKSPMCPTGMVWRKSHKRSSGKRVVGKCVRSPVRSLRSTSRMMSSRPFIASSLLNRNPVPSAPSLAQIEGVKSEMPALESVKGEYGFGTGCGYGFGSGCGYGFTYLG